MQHVLPRYLGGDPAGRGAVVAKRNAARPWNYGGYPQCGTRYLGVVPQSA